jgi:thiosulfate reductase cytochrome b subunit
MTGQTAAPARVPGMRHPVPVRVTHWINTLAFAALAVSGVAILIAHPRFYWGESGYFDTPAAFELPLAVNLDQSGWGRSLHFLAAWIAVFNGVAYVVWGLVSRHFQREFLGVRAATIRERPGYGSLQKRTYTTVVFVFLPIAILSGLTMSPAVTAAWPFLFTMFGGRQSARTIHFFAAALLIGFAVVHLLMVVGTGFRRNMRSMITGGNS